MEFNIDSPLLAKQSKLQEEANEMVRALDLDSLLSAIGMPARVGSSALGLMVRRDVDITVICEALDQRTHKAIANLGAEISMHELVRSVSFRNDTGRWNKVPEEYPDGLYLGLACQDAISQDWTFDIWFVDEPERQPDLKHIRTLPSKLTSDAREAILAIKTALGDEPAKYGTISSFQVYDAVLNNGVTDITAFDDWLK